MSRCSLVLIDDIHEEEESYYKTKMKIIYDKCMNASEHEALGDKPLEEVMEELGGWPVALGSRWVEDNFTLDAALVRLKELGYDHDFLAKIDIAPQFFDHEHNWIYIGVPQLGLDDKSYYSDDAYAS